MNKNERKIGKNERKIGKNRTNFDTRYHTNCVKLHKKAVYFYTASFESFVYSS